MEINESYCRLCAEMKPNSKLLDLQNESPKSHDTLFKLSRLNLSFLNFYDEENLPKTVCIVCLTSLDSAINFVDNIEKAQTSLREVFLQKPIKKEIEFTPNDNNASASKIIETAAIKKEDNAEIAELPDDWVTDSEIADYLPPKAKKRKKAKSKIKIKDEDIPLANLKSAWRDFSWHCAECEMQYPSIKELVSHSMELHSKCTTYKCPERECHSRKLTHDGFITHVKRHNRSLKRSCHICYERFTGPFEKLAKNHYVKHVMYTNICPGCFTSFPTTTELNLHKEKYYTDKRAERVRKDKSKEEDLNCKICNKTYATHSSLILHLKLHKERRKDHTCDICGKCYYNKQTLSAHLAGHLNIRPHQCKICNFAFRTLSQLRAHVGIHGGAKPFSCDQCGKSFRLQKNLTSHMIVHTDALPFACSYCEKAFKFKTLLNSHIRQHTGVKPYSCDICQRDFTNWPNYNKHMKRRHGINMAKKKHTPDGVFPINPMTGEVQIVPITSNTEEWKQSVLIKKPKKKLEEVGNDPSNNIDVKNEIATMV